MKLCTKNVLTAIWLLAFIVNVWPIIGLAADSHKSAEMVYCPLTKKLQPVKAVKTNVSGDPLEAICANDKIKKSFSRDLFNFSLQTSVKYDAKDFEDVLFKYFQKGKTAFKEFPQPAPTAPSEKLFKKTIATAGFGRTDENRSFHKLTTDNFSFARYGRPPNFQKILKFDFQISLLLKKISRRINPRSPPVFI